MRARGIIVWQHSLSLLPSGHPSYAAYRTDSRSQKVNDKKTALLQVRPDALGVCPPHVFAYAASFFLGNDRDEVSYILKTCMS
jgi:hypothetical protein